MDRLAAHLQDLEVNATVARDEAESLRRQLLKAQGELQELTLLHTSDLLRMERLVAKARLYLKF